MQRRTFIQSAAALGAASFTDPIVAFTRRDFPVIRIPESQRNFSSESIERAIKEFKKNVKNEELAWLFENCFPNTLDTTVTYNLVNGKPDTYVITGDINAMWLRDSSAQVWPYVAFANKDADLQKPDSRSYQQTDEVHSQRSLCQCLLS